VWGQSPHIGGFRGQGDGGRGAHHAGGLPPGQILRPTAKVPEGTEHGKEAAPAGGESGGRAHGPALGGWAGSVLQESLSAKRGSAQP
jgi:hypothetical protein